jgi:hypothetical protein
VIEQYGHRARLAQQRGEFLGLALADVQPRVGPRPMTHQAADRAVAGRSGKGSEFVERPVVQAIPAERDADQQGCIGRGGRRVQLSGLSGWKLTGRAGTTVEIACL